jgi:hypothetical protein
MTQVNLERQPFAKHIFYKGIYNHNNLDYSFTLTVEESGNSIQPNITVDFETWTSLLPFDYDKAYKQIIAIYLPNGNQETKD